MMYALLTKHAALCGMILLSVSGCVTSSPAPVDSFCLIAKPLWTSAEYPVEDEELENAIIEHNAVGVSLCGW